MSAAATAPRDWMGELDELVGRVDLPIYEGGSTLRRELREKPGERWFDVRVFKQTAALWVYEYQAHARGEIRRLRKHLGIRRGVDGALDGGKGGAPRNWGLTQEYMARTEDELRRCFAEGLTDRQSCEEIGWEWTDANRMRIARFRRSSGHERNPNGST